MAERLGPGEYIANIKAQVSPIMDGLKGLAKAELVPAAKHAGIGGGMFGGAGVFGISAIKALLLAACFAVSEFYAHVLHREILTALGLGFLTVGVLALLVAGVLALLGKNQVSKVKAPTATIEEAKASLNTISESVKTGIAEAKQVPTDTGRPAIGTGAWLSARHQDRLPVERHDADGL